MSKMRLLWSALILFILLVVSIHTAPSFATTADSATPIGLTETWIKQAQGGATPTAPRRTPVPTRTPTPTFDPAQSLNVKATATAFAPGAPLTASLTAKLSIEGEFAEALLTPDQSRLLLRTADGRIFAYALTNSESKPQFILKHGELTDGMALSDDGKYLASWNDATQSCQQGCPDMLVKIWNLVDGSLIRELTIRDNTRFASKNGVRWSHDSTRLLTWSREGEVEVWDVASGQNLLRLRHRAIVWGAAWNPDETRILTWTTNRAVNIYDAKSGEWRYELGHLEVIWNAMWSRDGSLILTGGFDGFAGIWDGASGIPHQLYYHGEYRPGRPNLETQLWSLAWSGDERRVFTGSLAGKVQVWDAGPSDGIVGKTIEKPLAVLGAGRPVTQLAANADGSRVFILAGGTLLWDGQSDTPLFRTAEAGQPNPTMDMVAVWNDYGVTIHSTMNGDILAHLTQETPVRGAQWLDDRRLLTWTDASEVHLWQLERRQSPTLTQTVNITPTPSLRPLPFIAMNEGQTNVRHQPLGRSVMGQIFTVFESEIRTVEVSLNGPLFGEVVTLELKTLDGQILARQAQFLPNIGGELMWLPFTFDPPIPITRGQPYRMELSSQEGRSGWAYTPDYYPYGVMYQIGTDGAWTSYRIHNDARFRVNVTDITTIQPTQTAIVQAHTAVPATQAVYAMTTTPRHQTEVAPITATAGAVGTKAALLGIPPEAAEGLRIGTASSLSDRFALRPGERLNFRVGNLQCCYMFVPANLKAVWSVTPAEGAAIDPETGVFTVDESAKHGTVYTITASLANGSVQLTTQVHVYTPEGNPLVGMWVEEVQFACAGNQTITPQTKIGELVFRADGSFTVTWMPFEVYIDYTGTYTYDLQTGQLALQPRNINYLPRDIRPSGTFNIDAEGRLNLRNIWLGRPPNGGTGEIACGHRFRRQSGMGR